MISCFAAMMVVSLMLWAKCHRFMVRALRSLADVHHTWVLSQRTIQALVLIRTKNLATDPAPPGSRTRVRGAQLSHDGCVSAVLFTVYEMNANTALPEKSIWPSGWVGPASLLIGYTRL